MSDAPAYEKVDDLPAVVQPTTHLLPCPECGQQCNGTTGLGVHRSVKHGYKGDKKNRKTKKAPKRQPINRLVAVADDNSAEEWDTDELVAAAVSLLWPRGVIPAKALMPILRWRHATDIMLDEVRHAK